MDRLAAPRTVGIALLLMAFLLVATTVRYRYAVTDGNAARVESPKLTQALPTSLNIPTQPRHHPTTAATTASKPSTISTPSSTARAPSSTPSIPSITPSSSLAQSTPPAANTYPSAISNSIPTSSLSTPTPTDSPQFRTHGGLVRDLVPPPPTWRMWTYPIPYELLYNIRPGKSKYVLPSFSLATKNDAGYIWETLLHDLLTGKTKDPRWAAWTTSDPSQASAFYVPMYLIGVIRLEAEGHLTPDAPPAAEIFYSSDLDDYAQRIYVHVRDMWPYWNRTFGYDHVLTAAADEGVGQLRPHDGAECGPPWPVRDHVRQMHVMSCLGAYTAPYFYANRDVVLAPFEMRNGVRERALVGAIPPNDPEDPVTCRPILASFSGRPYVFPRLNMQPAWGDLRNRLFEMYANDTEIVLRERSSGDYVDLLDQSTFCLHLPGFFPQRWSSRLIHLLDAGCVPVVLVDNLELPYSDFIDWSRAVVRISEYAAHQPGKLKELLREIPPHVVRAKAANVRILARLLAADLENGPKLTQRPRDPDTFDFAIASLYRKMQRFNTDTHRQA